MSIGNIPESLSQAILVGITLVGRLGFLGTDAARGQIGGVQVAYRVHFSKEPVRFVSVSDFRQFIGSVRFGSESQFSRFDAVRPALFGRVVARSGSDRFVSASGSGRFRNKTVRFGSVSYSFLIRIELQSLTLMFFADCQHENWPRLQEHDRGTLVWNGTYYYHYYYYYYDY